MSRPSNMLSTYLNAQPRDIYHIVGALMGYVNADPYFKTNELDEAIHYTLTHGVTESELFSPFDPEIVYCEDESKWDDRYHSLAIVYLKDNFCRKRIDHVKAVAHNLRPVTDAPVPSSQPRSDMARTIPSGQKAAVNTDKDTRRQTDTGKKTQDQQDTEKYLTTAQKHVVTKVIFAMAFVMLVAAMVSIIK